MNNLLLIIGFYLIALAELGFWPYFPLNEAWPSLLLLAILVVALRSKNTLSVWLGAAWGGLLLNVFFYPRGITAFLAVLILVAALQLIRRFVDCGGWLTVLGLLAAFSWLYQPTVYCLEFLLAFFFPEWLRPVSPNWFFLGMQLIYNMIIIVSVWLVLPAKYKERLVS